MKSYVRIFLFFVACVMASNAMRLQSIDPADIDENFDINRWIYYMNKYAYEFIRHENYYRKQFNNENQEKERENLVDCTSMQLLQELTPQIQDMLKCENESVAEIIEPIQLYDTIEEKQMVETINYFGTGLSYTVKMFEFILKHYELEEEIKNKVNCYYLQRAYESASSLRQNTLCHKFSY